MGAVSDGEGILAAILEEPGDDGLRLIYADWLEETGQAERAEFVREQMRIAGMPLASNDPYHRRFTVARRLLITVGPKIAPAGFDTILSKKWFDLRAEAKGVSFWRGFVHAVRCPLAAWLEHGRSICAAHPVERVELSDREPWISYPSDDDVPAYVWFPDDTPSEPDELPHRLYDILQGGKPAPDAGRDYPSREAAIDALSRACLLHAGARHLRPAHAL